jgi:hypothetical protein
MDPQTVPGISGEFEGEIQSYPAVVRSQLLSPLPGYLRYRGVMPSWDNTARRRNRGHILAGATPALYRHWLSEMVKQSLERNGTSDALVFINAWNEWAEGTHLEPDQRFGHAWLDATRQGLCSGVGAWYRDRGLPIETPAVEAALDAHLEASGHPPAAHRVPIPAGSESSSPVA